MKNNLFINFKQVFFNQKWHFSSEISRSLQLIRIINKKGSSLIKGLYYITFETKQTKNNQKIKKGTAMEQNKQLSLQFASISGKKVTAGFTGGDVTSDVGVLVMRETAKRIGIIEQLAETIHDKRHQSYVKHEITELLMQRIF